MSFIADLHIHSHYSRATSRQLNLEHLHQWGQLKGLRVIATGDFTHPGWLSELKEKLQPAEPGLYTLKKEFSSTTQREVARACEGDVRFILSAEISNIYKKGDKVRKVHNVLLSPSLETAQKIQDRLEQIGNIRSDGRPILGLDSRDLLEIVLEEDEEACLIPAHIWTPWFSALGSKSGFDSIEECYGDLSKHIFAVETGLSSDPPMNWRVSSLDKYTLVSNSDAHSPQKLAREANLFHCELSYPAMIEALKSGDPALFGGTIEFYPQEGKYHFDGHRKCGVRLSPVETKANNGICPVCGKKVTLGVTHRVDELADRDPGATHAKALPFTSLIPLSEVVAEVVGQGENTKRVIAKLDHLLVKLGPELDILMNIPLIDIERVGGLMTREAIERMRNSHVHIDAGYDGEYGIVKLFSKEERDKFLSSSFFVEE
ncbi:DNA helicase UvrD, partial [candidate division KSB1 bacterium]|nr:DNA helicase UvrD [candidate division KSB1 bacterium]